MKSSHSFTIQLNLVYLNWQLLALATFLKTETLISNSFEKLELLVLDLIPGRFGIRGFII